ncbi:stage II sporulation protein AA (anti-sigma F factor antagonist) [Thermomonospora echinospora]|uniref:Stage II sporulation protein AA (Anti-sigma F factor antagonist) n=1 Tax=Thermomonospora echinospora TaxID=1992 RepID=A0A1H5TKC3_9ACTN|nr:STAS domain-containing protein [Thermomonospora echinospora]SEF63249.1 stage II sporulation protein AA (anti-sigma F factor antagonist) [Thermomonospora echinospora]
MADIVVDMVVVEREGHTVAMLCGEIDCCTGPDVYARLMDLAARLDRPLVLDMSGIAFCDGSALRTISAVTAECARRDVPVAMVGLRPYLEGLFRAFGLHERLPLCATYQDALWCLLPLSDEEIAAWPIG